MRSVGIVITGRTGSGKTTLATGVEEALSLPLVSSGDIARQIAESDPHAKAGLERGDWAPEQAIRTEVLAQIEAATATAGDFIIEGFPRRLEQLYILESVDAEMMYFEIDTNPLVCLRRLITRNREHDHPDAVAIRFRHYVEYTQPMLDMLHDYLHILDGYNDTAELVGEVCTIYRSVKEALCS